MKSWLRYAGMVATFGVASGSAVAQADLPAAPTPTSATLAQYQSTLPSGVTVERPTGTVLPLSLDDAITRALAHNLGVELTLTNERRIRGLQSTVLNALTPSLTARGSSSTQEINLAAMGFKAQTVAAFGLTNFATIVKVNVTSAQLALDQQTVQRAGVLSLSRVAKRPEQSRRCRRPTRASPWRSRRGCSICVSWRTRLRLRMRGSQVASDEVAFGQARDRQAAGVGVHLDSLRAEVQLKNQQQVLISVESTYRKDKIALNRTMGIAADQEIDLTDRTPYADVAMLSHDDLLVRAYGGRKDLLGLEAQREVLVKTERAARYERLPTVAMSGYYGCARRNDGAVSRCVFRDGAAQLSDL